MCKEAAISQPIYCTLKYSKIVGILRPQCKQLVYRNDGCNVHGDTTLNLYIDLDRRTQ